MLNGRRFFQGRAQRTRLTDVQRKAAVQVHAWCGARMESKYNEGGTTRVVRREGVGGTRVRGSVDRTDTVPTAARTATGSLAEVPPQWVKRQAGKRGGGMNCDDERSTTTCCGFKILGSQSTSTQRTLRQPWQRPRAHSASKGKGQGQGKQLLPSTRCSTPPLFFPLPSYLCDSFLFSNWSSEARLGVRGSG